MPDLDGDHPRRGRARRAAAGLGFSALFVVTMLLGMPAALAREAPEEDGLAPPGAGAGAAAAAAVGAGAAGAQLPARPAALEDEPVHQAQEQAGALLADQPEPASEPAPEPLPVPAPAPVSDTGAKAAGRQSREPEAPEEPGGVLPWLVTPSTDQRRPAAAQPPPPPPPPPPPEPERDGGRRDPTWPYFGIRPHLLGVGDDPAFEVSGERISGGSAMVTGQIGGDAPTIHHTSANGKALPLRPAASIVAKVRRETISAFNAEWAFERWEVDGTGRKPAMTATGTELRLPPGPRSRNVYARYKVTSEPGTKVDVYFKPFGSRSPEVPVEIVVPASADGTRPEQVVEVVTGPGTSVRLPYDVPVTVTAPEIWTDYDDEYVFRAWHASDPGDVVGTQIDTFMVTTWTVVPGANVYPIYDRYDRVPPLVEVIARGDLPRLAARAHKALDDVLWSLVP